MSLPTSGNETFDSLSALSVILDLANGFAEDKSLLTAVVALQLAGVTGADEETRWNAALASLLRHLGCTGFAPTEGRLVDDDIALRGNLQRTDKRRVTGVARAVGRASEGRLRQLSSVVSMVSQRKELAAHWTREACGAARVLAQQLALGPGVEQALDEVFEQFDGRGAPGGLKGEAISLVARLSQAAHEAVLAWLDGGAAPARTVVTAHAGTALDPVLAKAVSGLIEGEPGAYLERHLPALLALAQRRKLVGLEALAAAFGDFADLQLPDGVGHSRVVARRVEVAAAQLGFTASEQRDVVLAAHLHDLGTVALPTSLWLTPRAFRPGERERAQGHVSFTERVLMAAAPLAPIARIAAAHHERLDGKGYHHGVREGSLPRTARLLAAADRWVGLQSARPHRPALSRSAATEALRREVLDGAVDGVCVEALIDGTASVLPANALTTRELDVLRLLARGLTNKEIAKALGISDRTVQHHTIHVYEKLEVDTRAGATLKASEQGLLG